MKRKLLTIGIPIFKRYDNLSILLRQINEQILNNNLTDEIEVLICDNTGPDKHNIEYISTYLEKQYLRYIDNRENIGVINNVLKVIENSLGKYCFLVGDDEELLEGKLIECITLLKTMPETVIAVIFDKEMSNEQCILNYLESTEKYFWYYGNVGCSALNTDAVKEYFLCNKKNTLWPQTELIFNAASQRKSDFYIVKTQIFHSPNHRKNTRYNSYYVYKAGFLSLIETAINIQDSEVQSAAVKNINSRYSNLLEILLINYIFNDTKSDTKKNRREISKSKKELNEHIFDKTIFYFNIFSRIPKWVYIFIFKIFKKYDNIKNNVINIEDKKYKVNEDYT